MYILLIYPHGSSFPSIPIYSHHSLNRHLHPAPFAKVSSRTPLRRSANVKWGRRILRRFNGTCLTSRMAL